MGPLQEELQGVIERFLFKSDDNGFCVFILHGKSNQETIVKGYLSSINPGEHVCLQGTWVMHAKFGKQFEATSVSTKLPETVVGLKKYLGSGLIKGIGPVYAEKLVNYFGVQVLEIIDQFPERLKEVPGIGQKRHEQIVTAWHDQKEIATIMVFLQDKGVSTAFAIKIYKKYGRESVAVLQENPYRLAEEIWGIGFKIADTIAQKLGFEKHSLKRIKAGLLFALQDITNQGHLYAELTALRTTVCTLLEIEYVEHEVTLRTALHELYDTDKIKLISYNDEHLLCLSMHYALEKAVAKKIRDLLSYASLHIFDLQKLYHKVRSTSEHTIQLHEDQQKGIMSCFEHKVAIITGGPGTGKTTVIKKLLSLLDEHRISYQLAAPTGRAAKRMMESTGRHALTLHRLLEFDISTMRFAHNEQNALKGDFFIIDEASMIDIFLANSLLKAIPMHAHLIFIGDIDQLPSVGAGNFLRDVIASSCVATTRLTQIFRQAQDSLIVVNAHRVNNGEFPTSFMPDSRRDFVFVKEEDPGKVMEYLREIFTDKLKKYGISSADATVLVPMNRGIIGTHTLNHNLQQLLNHSEKPHLIYHGVTYKVDDRVMQIRNNYDKLVFNGDVGTIEEINVEDRTMNVAYAERIVTYEYDELNEIVLAYALSIHKSQGSEYQAVIIPLFMQHFMLLQRNLLYTAITRAKKLCILIGQPKAIAMAIKNNKSVLRKTLLQQFLTSDLSCR